MEDRHRIYTDSENQEKQREVNSAFVSQSTGDVRCKLQALKGFGRISASQLLEAANGVFISPDAEGKERRIGRSRPHSCHFESE